MVSLFEKDAFICTPHANTNCSARFDRTSPLFAIDCNEFGQPHWGRGAVLILMQGLHGHAKISGLSEGIPGLICRGMVSRAHLKDKDGSWFWLVLTGSKWTVVSKTLS